MAAMTQATPALLLGPILRYVDESRATVWVETSEPCTATVRVDGKEFSERTWEVFGHHYALVQIDGLERGKTHPYQLDIDGAQVWPEQGGRDSVIRTLSENSAVRLSFGSCRRGEKQSPRMLREIGADALVALANQMSDTPHSLWPDAMLLLGDQIYADIPSEDIATRLEKRREAGQGPKAVRESKGDGGDRDVSQEICDFEEYSWLYHESWSDPDVRWLLSTVPSCMILDDHDLRDDWNSSRFWREEMTAQPWWEDRVAGAFSSYFVYQHLGNLSPDELAEEPTYQQLRTRTQPAERERLLTDFSVEADADPATSKWSYHRDFGRVRVLMLDVRASRHLHQGDRLVMDHSEWDWVRKMSLDADVDHLVFGSSLPAFMVPALHHIEGWNEATVELLDKHPHQSKLAEWMRRTVDLEHWAAFRRSFDNFVELLTELARGEGGTAPSSILVLGGDVHCSYLEEVELTDPSVADSQTQVHQLVMSPYRNPLNLPIRVVNQIARLRPIIAVMRLLARGRGVVEPPVSWGVSDGIWFDNGVMTLVLEGRHAHVEVDHARVVWPLRGLGRFLTRVPFAMPRTKGRTSDGGDAKSAPRQILRRTLNKKLAG